MINMLDRKCIASTLIEDKNCIWHQRYDHLNFMSLNLMRMKNMVYGLPKITMPKKLCEK